MSELDLTFSSSEDEDYLDLKSDSSEDSPSSGKRSRDPAEALPKEIMGEVFAYHASADWRAPLKLSLVCRNWTETLNRTPQVWAFLQISKWDGLFEESFHIWLSRARTCPLRFGWVKKDNLPTLRFCNNVRALDYLGHASDLNKLVIPTLKFLSLKSYSLYEPTGSMNRPPPTDLRNLTPSLVALDVAEYHKVAELREKIPGHIRELHIHPRHGLHSHLLLESFSQKLHTLCIHTDAYFPMSIDAQDPVVLPNLQKLIIRWGFARAQSGKLVNFIDNIHTPQLRILHEMGARTCGVSTPRSYQLRPTITEYITENPREEGSFPRELENIEILRIACTISNPEHIPAVPQCNILSDVAGNPDVCPKLREFELFIGAEKRMPELKARIEQDITNIAARDPTPRMRSTIIFGTRRWANLDLFSAHVDNCFYVA